MRSTVSRSALLTTLIFLPTPPGGEAQSIPSNYRYVDSSQETGAFVGFASVGTGRFGYGPGDGTVVGGRYGIDFAGPLTFEVVASVLDGTRDIINPGRDEGDRKVAEADSQVGAVDGRLKLTLTGPRTWRGLSPFLLFGGGMAFDLSGEHPAEADLEPADRFDFGRSFFGTLGGGSRVVVSERLVFRVDGIFSIWKLDTPPGFSDPSRGFGNVEKGEWVQGLRLTLGAAIRF